MEAETTQNMFKFNVKNLGCLNKGEFTQ